MFTKSAKFYDALYNFKDYSAASEELHAMVQKHNPDARRLSGRSLRYRKASRISGQLL